MQTVVPKFTKEQWVFLAVFEALEGAVSIELAGMITPLLPGPLIHLINTTESLGWVEKVGDDCLALSGSTPEAIKKKLTQINNGQRLSEMLDQFNIDQWKANINKESLVKFLGKAGREQQASELEIELAHEALERGDSERGRLLFYQAATRLAALHKKDEAAVLFIETVFVLSNLTFAAGKVFSEIEDLLHKVQDVSRSLGDKRSHALASLHLGWLYYFTFRREEALMALTIGAEELEDIEDSDIRSQSALFLGLNAFIKGQYREAYDHLEIAEIHFESAKHTIPENPMIPIFFGLCAAYLGKFHRAIGTLDFVHRLSLEHSDKALGSILRAVLGTILVIIGKTPQGYVHLKKALSEAIDIQNDLGTYLARGGTAIWCFVEGRIKESYDILKQTLIEGTKAGFVRQFASPWVLEMLYEYHRLGFDPIPDFQYTDVVDRILGGFNMHLQGVAYRLRANEALDGGADISSITHEFRKSESYLRQAGDPVQLSKTLLELAKLSMSRGNRAEASTLAKEAWHCLGGYYEEFFPVELQYLLGSNGEVTKDKASNKDLVEKYLEMIESLYPRESQEEIFFRVMTETCRMFGAERSGYFSFPGRHATGRPESRALFNLSPKETSSARFKASLHVIGKVFREGKPIVDKITVHETALGKKIKRGVLCIPVEVKGRIHGVLYYDSSYLDNVFQHVDLSIAKRMARLTNIVVERRLNYLKVQHQVEALSYEKSQRKEGRNAEIVFRSSVMEKLLAQTDKIAVTDSTVIILGETGTGKELLAHRIHRRSRRADGAFIVVDATTIPENLIESELFGYEKGAFTGAEKRKVGSIEIAHKGTLFLDEIGELSLQAQTKLLRALQEKIVRRVGGLEPIESDFRLITATNRNLEQEIAAGRFREDLFFRLNVISLTIPPLRDRAEDAVYLVQHFVENYSKKYQRNYHQLSNDQKAAIKKYAWPGNVRELINKVESAVILSSGNRLDLALSWHKPMIPQDPFADKPSLREVQRRYIRHVIELTHRKISGPGGAAEILGMKRTSLYSKMKALGIRPNH